MTKFYFGVGLLLFLFITGIFVGVFMDNTHTEIANKLSAACEKTLSGDFDGGYALSQQAKKLWQAHWRATAAACDHAPMDEIDSLFASLHSYWVKNDDAHFAGSCAELVQLVQAVADAHRLSWWNLL